MSDEREYTTEDNDALAAEFQTLMIAELTRRGAHFTEATAVNFSNINIDVHIWFEDYWYRYSFNYIGIGWLRRIKLADMTLAEYVADYVGRKLAELKSSVAHEIEECTKLLKNTTNMWPHDVERRRERLVNAQKIAAWLTQD